MQEFIASFQENNNKGQGLLRVTGKSRPVIYKGCSAATGELKKPEKDTLIYIDRIAQSTTSKSMFGHVTHLKYSDGVKEYNINGWISLASLFVTPVSYKYEKHNYYDF